MEVQLTMSMSGEHGDAQVLANGLVVSRPEGWSGVVGLCATLFKLRIGFAIMFSAIGGAVLATGGWPDLVGTGILALAVLSAASGAGAFNHWFDRDIDAVMGRTANRPFVNGRLGPHLGWPVFFGLMMLGGSVLAGWYFNVVSGVLVAAGALTYAVVYTVWLKRKSDWNIVLGGAAGSWAVLAGAAAGGSLIDPAVLLLAGVLFLWTPSHFWSLAIALVDDYARAGIPMLPVTRGVATAVRWSLINTIMLTVATLLLVATIGSLLLWLFAGFGVIWLLFATGRMVQRPERKTAMLAFKASLIHLGTLLLGVFANVAVP